MSKIGTTQNILESVVSNLDNKIQNMSASLSTFKDTDIATEASNSTKLQILQNMQASLLTQANTTPAIALNLI